MLVVIVSLGLISDWFLNRRVINNREVPSFELLSKQINFEDSFFSNSWRSIWSKLPATFQLKLDRWKPSPPADEVRLTACTLLPKHGVKALPLLLGKLNDPDDKMKRTALHSVYVLGHSNQLTWDFLGSMVKNRAQKPDLRCEALIALVGLHWEDHRMMSFLNEWIVPDEVILDSFKTITGFNPYSSFSSFAGTQSSGSPILYQLKFKLPVSFFLSLFEQNTTNHAKMAFCFLNGYPMDVSPFKQRMSEYIDDQDDFVRTNAYQFLVRALERDRSLKGAPEYFFRAASDPLISIQRLAIRFLGNRYEPTSDITKVIFEMAASTDTGVSQSALLLISRLSGVSGNPFKPDENQLALVENLSKSGDPITRRMASELLGRWIEGSFEKLLESFLLMTFPHGENPLNSLSIRIQQMYPQSDDHKEIVLDRLREIHSEAQSLRGEIASFLTVAEPYEPVPVLLRIRMDQASRKRSWLFSLAGKELVHSPELLKALETSADDSLNPNQFQDATTRWNLDSNFSKVQPHLETAYQSSSPFLHNQAVNILKRMGLDAVPILEKFLDEEEERSRIYALVLICEILQEMDRIEPYLESVIKVPGPTVLKVVKQLKEYYSKPPENRRRSFQSMFVR